MAVPVGGKIGEIRHAERSEHVEHPCETVIGAGHVEPYAGFQGRRHDMMGNSHPSAGKMVKGQGPVYPAPQFGLGLWVATRDDGRKQLDPLFEQAHPHQLVRKVDGVPLHGIDVPVPPRLKNERQHGPQSQVYPAQGT
ncbi:hypothetical protein, partial [Desulfovibrio piger]|uniref:hypothetical protein n=1 Tax=Desulfovibrio piger TaxID=901 RepID=UPI0026EE43A9